jgi:hypothetical protein
MAASLVVQGFLATPTGRQRASGPTELLREAKPAVSSPASAADVRQLRSRVLKEFGPASARTIRRENHVVLSGHGRLQGLLL